MNTTLIIPISACVLTPKTRTNLPSLKISEGWSFYWVIPKVMYTCLFTIHFRKINVCSKMIVEQYFKKNHMQTHACHKQC